MLRETLPLSHAPKQPHDIYMSRRHPLVVYGKRMKALLTLPIQTTEHSLDPDHTDPAVRIYAAGSCIMSALMLLQDAQDDYAHLIQGYRIKLGSQNAVDNYSTDSVPIEPHKRKISTIQIDIYTRSRNVGS